MTNIEKASFALLALVIMVFTMGFIGNVQATAVTDVNTARGTVSCNWPVDCGPLRAQARTNTLGLAQRTGAVAGQNTNGNGVTVTLSRFGVAGNWVSVNQSQTLSGFGTPQVRSSWRNLNVYINLIHSEGSAR